MTFLLQWTSVAEDCKYDPLEAAATVSTSQPVLALKEYDITARKAALAKNQLVIVLMAVPKHFFHFKYTRLERIALILLSDTLILVLKRSKQRKNSLIFLLYLYFREGPDSIFDGPCSKSQNHAVVLVGYGKSKKHGIAYWVNSIALLLFFLIFHFLTAVIIVFRLYATVGALNGAGWLRIRSSLNVLTYF